MAKYPGVRTYRGLVPPQYLQQEAPEEESLAAAAPAASPWTPAPPVASTRQIRRGMAQQRLLGNPAAYRPDQQVQLRNNGRNGEVMYNILFGQRDAERMAYRDANTRANSLAGAGVRGMDAQTQGLRVDAEGRAAMYPGMVEGQTLQNRAAAQGIEQSAKLFPGQLDEQGLRLHRMRDENILFPDQGQLQLDAGREALRQSKQTFDAQRDSLPMVPWMPILEKGMQPGMQEAPVLMDQPVTDLKGNPVMGPDGKPAFNRVPVLDGKDQAVMSRTTIAGPHANQILGMVPGMRASGGGKKLDQVTAQRFLQQAGGDKEKARELARQAGYTF